MYGKVAKTLNKKDNVAVLFTDVKKGEKYSVVSSWDGSTICSLVALEDIYFGHKAAIHDIQKGQSVIKYGEGIGEATEDIVCGQWVHTHNLSSNRGR